MVAINVPPVVHASSVENFYELAHNYERGTRIVALGYLKDLEGSVRVPHAIHLMPPLAHTHGVPFWLLCGYLGNPREAEHAGAFIGDFGEIVEVMKIPLNAVRRLFVLTEGAPARNPGELEALAERTQEEFRYQLDSEGTIDAFYYKAERDEGQLIAYLTKGGKIIDPAIHLAICRKTDKGYEWQVINEHL